MSRTNPRPPSVTAFCVLLLVFFTWGLVRGLFEMNTNLYGVPGRELALQTFLGPAVAAPCVFFMLQGRNWARILFWVAYGPVALGLALWLPTPLNCTRVGLYLVMSVAIALPNAHWFFTNRDYRRRIMAPPRPRRRGNEGDGRSRRSGDFQY